MPLSPATSRSCRSQEPAAPASDILCQPLLVARPSSNAAAGGAPFAAAAGSTMGPERHLQLLRRASEAFTTIRIAQKKEEGEINRDPDRFVNWYAWIGAPRYAVEGGWASTVRQRAAVRVMSGQVAASLANMRVSTSHSSSSHRILPVSTS